MDPCVSCEPCAIIPKEPILRRLKPLSFQKETENQSEDPERSETCNLGQVVGGFLGCKSTSQ